MFDFFYKVKLFFMNICASYMLYVYGGLILSLIILLTLLIFLPLWISLFLMPIITFVISNILINDKKDKNYIYGILIGSVIILFFGIFIYL